MCIELYWMTLTTCQNKLNAFGNRNFCCIPLFKNPTFDRDCNKFDIGFYISKWTCKRQAIYNFVSKSDSFIIETSTKVCEIYFFIVSKLFVQMEGALSLRYHKAICGICRVEMGKQKKWDHAKYIKSCLLGQ